MQIIVIKGGIHRTPDEFDFGTLVSTTDKVTLPLTLLNSAEWPVMVTDVYPLAPDPLLSLGFLKGTLLMPNVHTKVADVSYTGRDQGYFSGMVVARTNDSNPANTYIEVSYAASVLHGEFLWQPNTTFASNGGPISRTLTLTSKFPQVRSPIAEPHRTPISQPHRTPIAPPSQPHRSPIAAPSQPQPRCAPHLVALALPPPPTPSRLCRPLTRALARGRGSPSSSSRRRFLIQTLRC